jgi:hypothetical protein
MFREAFMADKSKVRDQHVQGWRFQLALFANVVSDEVFADASAVVDLQIYRLTLVRRSISCRQYG